MNILFISRAYPPVVGGIENHNEALAEWLGRQPNTNVTLIVNRFGKKFLPFFLPYAIMKSLLLARRHDVILLGDGVLSVVGWKLKFFFRKKPMISVVHGLDITYPFFLYQLLWVRVFLPKLDRLIAVGNETIRAGAARGILLSHFVFVPNGIDPNAHWNENFTRKDLEGIIGESAEGKFFLLTSGRLARRKGVAWFIREVLPTLPRETRYIVAGDGNDKANIVRAIEETHAYSQVKILGYVSDRARDILMNTCDIFVQPNIRIANDMEGFGISVLEAASCGIPVVVSNLEGLKDAVADGKNGFLAEPERPESWKMILESLLNDEKKRKSFGQSARGYTAEHFNWNTIAACYRGILQEEIEKSTGIKPTITFAD